MRPSPRRPPLPTAIELAHAPELAILIALETLLEMTTTTIQLSLPELDLVQRDCGLLDPEEDHRDLILAQGILDLAEALRHTIQIYRDLTLQP
jgi:hypothetical protein